MQSLHNLPSKIKVVPLVVVGSRYLVRFWLATLQCSNSPLHGQKCIVAVVVMMVVEVLVVAVRCCYGFVKLVTILFNQQDWKECSLKQRQNQTASLSLIPQMTNLTTSIIPHQ